MGNVVNSLSVWKIKAEDSNMVFKANRNVKLNMFVSFVLLTTRYMRDTLSNGFTPVSQHKLKLMSSSESLFQKRLKFFTLN